MGDSKMKKGIKGKVNNAKKRMMKEPIRKGEGGENAELGTRSFFRGSLSAPYSIFSPGSLTLLRSFFEFSFSLVAQTLAAQLVVR